MTRVEYLWCRIAQLRNQGASHLWAQFLARLELGEKPAGQTQHKPAGRFPALVAAVASEINARKKRSY